MSHATTQVSSDIDVKRPESHQGNVSTRFNFKSLKSGQQLSLQSKRRCSQSKRKLLHLPSTTYALMRFAEESACRLLTWLYGAKIPCTIEKKICKSTRKHYLNNSYSCYEKFKNEKKSVDMVYFYFFFFLPCYSVSRYFSTCLPCLETPSFAQ